MKPHIDGKVASYVAMEAAKRGPIRIGPGDDVLPAVTAPVAPAATPTDRRKAPPRLRKPSPHHTTPSRADYVYPAAREIGGESRQATVIAARPAKFDRDILALG